MCAAARLKWFERVQDRDSGYTGQRLLKMELPSRMKRGRTQRRSIVVKEFSRSHIKYDNILFCFSKKERTKKYLNSLSFAGVVASNIACEQLYNVTVYTIFQRVTLTTLPSSLESLLDFDGLVSTMVRFHKWTVEVVSIKLDDLVTGRVSSNYFSLCPYKK